MDAGPEYEGSETYFFHQHNSLCIGLAKPRLYTNMTIVHVDLEEMSHINNIREVTNQLQLKKKQVSLTTMRR